MEEAKSVYGVKSGFGIDPTAQMIINSLFNTYMNGFPDHEKGLWGIVEDLCVESSLKIQVDQLKEKYSNTKWVIR